MLEYIHDNVQAGAPEPNWSDIIPPDYRAIILPKHGLKSYVLQYRSCLIALSDIQKNEIKDDLINQNRICDLLSGNASCRSIDDVPDSIKSVLDDLFNLSYNLLREITVDGVAIRDAHYKVIYDSMPYPVCAFCGLEDFDALGSPREDLDHVLLKDKYPFAAANLLNLVPMGMKCNQKYKHESNILFSPSGKRRKFFYPYGDSYATVSLDDSIPFSGSTDRDIPQWKVDLLPASEECETWDVVFKIRERYVRDYLTPKFKRWVDLFGRYAACRQDISLRNDGEIVNLIDDYISYLDAEGFGDRAFLKAAMFRMLRKQCVSGNEDVLLLLKAAIQSGIKCL